MTDFVEELQTLGYGIKVAPLPSDDATIVEISLEYGANPRVLGRMWIDIKIMKGVRDEGKEGRLV
jgi:hypothetical protein